MKVSVGVNLLAGVWIWLHKQSGEVERQIYSKVGGIVGVVEEGGADIRSGIGRIAENAEEAIRTAAMRGIVGAGLATFLILLVAFLVKQDQRVVHWVVWFGAAALALAGPLIMAGTYVMIRRKTAGAIKKATELANSKAEELGSQKPSKVPVISGSSPAESRREEN